MECGVQLPHSVMMAGTWQRNPPYGAHASSTKADGSMAMEGPMRTAAKAGARAKERPIVG